jgi:hypothetical protein
MTLAEDYREVKMMATAGGKDMEMATDMEKGRQKTYLVAYPGDTSTGYTIQIIRVSPASVA